MDKRLRSADFRYYRSKRNSTFNYDWALQPIRYQPPEVIQIKRKSTNAVLETRYANRRPSRLKSLPRGTKTPEKQDKRPSKLLQFVWIIICSTGLFVHVYLTTKEYLQYKTTTQVSISLPKAIRPPAISFCYDLVSSIDPQMLTEEQRILYQSNNCSFELRQGKKCSSIPLGYNMFDLMTNITRNLSMISTFGKNAFSIDIYYKLGYKCSKISRKMNETIFLTSGEMDNLEIFPGRVVYSLEFNVIPIVLFMTAHDSDKLSYSREGNTVATLFDYSEPNAIYVTYDEVETTFLQYPFESNCLPYREPGKYKSRGNCIEKCYELKFEAKHNVDDRFITTDNYSEVKYNEIKPDYDRDIDNECDKICHLNCITREYFISIIEKYRLNFTDRYHDLVEGEQGWIQTLFTFLSSRPYSKVVLLPATDINSFIIFIASISGLWLGCSLHGTVASLYVAVKSIGHVNCS